MADAAGLKAIFPAFAAVDDAVIDFWLARAVNIVDSNWHEEDRDFGAYLLACHNMSINGIGTDSNTAVNVKRVKSGSFEIERFDDSALTQIMTTTYGKQFYALMRSNLGPMLVTGNGFA